MLAGDELTIRSVVTDYGPDDAFSPPNGDGVQVDVLLPPLLSILSISPGPGATAPFCTDTYATDGHIRCRFLTLPRDQSLAVDIKVRPPGPGTLHVDASVGTGFIANDPEPQNNSFSTDITVLNGFVLTVQKPGNGTGSVTSDKPGITVWQYVLPSVRDRTRS